MAVYCSQCGTKNSDDAANCVSCNATIARVMPNSGGSSATGSKKYDFSPVNLAIGGICLLYLVFPTLGVFELIPDAVPIIGSLDEAAATTGLLMILSRIGLIPWSRTS